MNLSRDLNGGFEPQIISKHQRNMNGIEDNYNVFVFPSVTKTNRTYADWDLVISQLKIILSDILGA